MHRHTFTHAAHFSRFIPLSPLTILLRIWYFLIPTRLARLTFVIYRHFSYSVEFHSLSSLARATPGQVYLSYSLYNHTHSLPFPSPLYVNLVLILSFFFFLFFAPLFGEQPFFYPFLFYRFIAPRLRAPSSIIISSLAFSTLYLLTRSSLYLLNSLNLLDTHRNSRAPRWIFILCVSYLHTTGLWLKWLKSSISYPERFKRMHSE